MNVDAEQVVRIVVTAAEFDWTWSEQDIERFAAAMGWDLMNQRPGSGATMRTHLAIESPYAHAYVNGDLKEITLGVTDKFDTADRAGKETLARYFQQLGQSAKAQLGDARIEVLSQGFGLRYHWAKPMVFVELVANSNISLTLTNPMYRAWMQSVTAEYDEGGWVWGQESVRN
ncbi:DUF6301 family protein [Nocardia sp. NPDC101769]|uniref:DUF6301 family protein n=1 Tax=Nocardia sp. NPDC101769 TaxID=3364333 RepID=UPI00382EB71E